MRKLRIAVIASNFIRIPPRLKDIPHGYSGAPEMIVHEITEGLVKKGHNVTLFASGDSKTSAKLFWLTKKGLATTKGIGVKKHLLFELFHLSLAYQKIQKEKFDLINCHFDWPSSLFAPFVKIPTVITLHSPLNNFSPLMKKVLKCSSRNSNYISISNSQRKGFPELNYVETIYHGIDIKKFKFNIQPKNYFIFVGRIVPDKGAHLAIKICKKLGEKLYIIGDYSRDNDYYINYFKKEIEPNLDHKKIIWLGKWIPEKEVINFYRNARALILPLQWEEPFGLTMVEAMACGTPVVAYNRGSASEIIKDGKNGFLANDINEMTQKIKKIDTIHREDCRKWVEEKFTLEKMIENYEKIFYRILKMRR